jgi:hypothetical protein
VAGYSAVIRNLLAELDTTSGFGLFSIRESGSGASDPKEYKTPITYGCHLAYTNLMNKPPGSIYVNCARLVIYSS